MFAFGFLEIFITTFKVPVYLLCGFPGGSDGRESACKAGDAGSVPGLERYPGEGHGNLL